MARIVFASWDVSLVPSKQEYSSPGIKPGFLHEIRFILPDIVNGTLYGWAGFYMVPAATRITLSPMNPVGVNPGVSLASQVSGIPLPEFAGGTKIPTGMTFHRVSYLRGGTVEFAYYDDVIDPSWS